MLDNFQSLIVIHTKSTCIKYNINQFDDAINNADTD